MPEVFRFTAIISEVIDNQSEALEPRKLKIAMESIGIVMHPDILGTLINVPCVVTIVPLSTLVRNLPYKTAVFDTADGAKMALVPSE